MTAIVALGAGAVVALCCSAAYLWRLLRTLPLSRRIVNLLMPLSQIAFVICSFMLRPYFVHWNLIAFLAAVTGIICAALNPMFFKSLLDAERADIEAERAALLEDQVAAQEHYVLLMQQTQREAARIRTELDAELAGVEEALDAGDAASAQAHLAGAAHAVRTPQGRRCQHPVVDALLAAKDLWCREQNIDLTIEAEVPDDLTTPDVELCALFANALDNAINACAAVPEGARWIRLRAHPAHGHFLLEVENSCAAPGLAAPRKTQQAPQADVDAQHADAATTEGAPHPAHDDAGTLPRHGLGLSIMREIVERHAGDLSCTQDGGTFKSSAIWRL